MPTKTPACGWGEPRPIDSLLPELRRCLAGGPAAVLQAAPGAGKTTRVPLALLHEPWLAGQRIVMLEPRRLAASNAARYMAACLGEEVGGTVGYAIRFERRISAATRIEVLTEGLLTRRLQEDPALSGVGLVIFDEFHERNLHSDLALALCRDAQLGLREDLRLLVMSATLDGEPVARLLGDAPLLSCPGRSHPVEISYFPQEPRGPLSEVTARAVRRALAETEGDILVFLPGVAEIRACQELLTTEPGPGQPLLCPLYGDLPFAAQEQALLPGRQRKVVLATNIAETSLTIEGVRVVVDSGFMRRMRFEPATGLPRLATVRITAANAAQRAGRAGRLGPGRCYRLWTEAAQGSLRPFDTPQIRTADLAPLALELARWGVRQADSLAWLDAPPDGALAGARTLLRQLGALDDQNRLTNSGAAMADWPAHPRLAALLAAADKEDKALACDLTALLEERDISRHAGGPPSTTDSDVLERLAALVSWRRTGRAPTGTDPGALRAVARAAGQWRRRLRVPVGAEPQLDAPTIGRLLLAAYPDRLARERMPGRGRYLMAGGQGGRLSPRSGVRGAPLLVAVGFSGGREADGNIYLASAVSRELVEELFAHRLAWQRQVVWDGSQERVVAREVRCLGTLLLAERPAVAGADEVTAALLDGIRQLGLEALPWNDAAIQLCRRVNLLARLFPDEGWPECSFAGLLAEMDCWLPPGLTGLRSRADLTRIDLAELLTARLDGRQRHRLGQLAPTHLPVPSGHRVAIDYQEEGHPVLAVKLQELFGLAATPRIAEDRVPLQVHLLSPARRPIAVTQDLASFWNHGYPEVRRELRGRYPKHPWPEDPWRAVPTRASRPR